MRKRFTHIIGIFCVLILAGCSQKGSLPDLTETYLQKDDKPFGGSFAYKILNSVYHDEHKEIARESLSNIQGNLNWRKNTLYFSLGKNFFTEEEDIDPLLDFVHKGNTAFIAAENIDTTLLYRIGATLNRAATYSESKPNAFTTATTRTESRLATYAERHKYYYVPFSSGFGKSENQYFRPVGDGESETPNCIVFFWGKGRLYLHSDPRAFSNYFLMTGQNYQYFLQLLQLLPTHPENVIIDGYYNKKNRKSNSKDHSFFGTIHKNPPLAWGFYLFLAALLIYIVFNGKRRQAIVPIVPTLQNASVAFAEAISRLYLKEGDNKGIADKTVTYFKENFKNKYFLSATTALKNQLDAVSRKSGVPLEDTEKLFAIFQQIEDSADVSDDTLLKLNDQIQNFNKQQV